MRRGATIVAVLACAATAMAWAAAPEVKAVGGFDRPRRLAALERSGDAAVALMPGRVGPVALWQAADGVRGRSLRTDGADTEALLETRGVRGLAAGSAGGDGWWAWVERDLRDGRYRVAWRWRGEQRTAWEGVPSPEITAVRGGGAPELIVGVRREGRGLLEHVRWDAAREPLYESELRLTGVDALRADGRLWLGWLEGRSESALGRDRSEWSAYVSTLDGSGATPRRLGAGSARARGDAVRIGQHADGVHALWSAPGGALHWAAPDEDVVEVGRGRPVGLLGDAWFWYGTGALWRAPAGAPGDAEPVVRLPAAPTRMAGVVAGDARWFAWTSGRFEGGAEVWVVDDRRPYRPDWRDRVAARLDLDPWRLWASLAGRAATSLLLGALLAVAATPLTWLAAVVASRTVPPRAGALAWAGALLGAGVLALLALMAVAVGPHSFAGARSVLGGPATIGAVLGTAVAFAWWARRRANAEPTLALLSAAWLACALGGALWLFVTLPMWQEALAGVP